MLGAKYNENKKTVEFRLFSKNATKVLLCIFDKHKNEDPIMTLNMEKDEDDIWSTSVKDYILNCRKRPIFYGFRVFGNNWEYNEKYKSGTDIGFKSKFDENGNRFNPNKIAFDPYCTEISHLGSEVSPNFSMFRSGGDFYLKDNAKWAPKSVFFENEKIKVRKIPPRPFNKEIIGEVHIKDLTQNFNIEEKGTFKGAWKFAENIKNLGITMVEFLPLNEYDTKQNGYNHWGYMPLGYFSLARRYCYDKTFGNLINEFRLMVDEFHKNGIKVCLDMVYNHTGEAGLVNDNVQDATLLSYALIDNASYYKVFKNGYYRSNSGCGNDFNVADENVMKLIVESIVYWTNQGVDAFRFDLAAALLECGCGCEEIYDSFNSLANKLKTMLKERNVNVVDDFNQAQEGIILIAEPWTCGGKDCYQLGNFPSFWAEWNDIFRDVCRKITLRPAEINPKQIREIMEGTPSKFKNINKSINYIASHDGFSLFDLNNYTKKSQSTLGGSDYEICGNYQNNPQKQENAIRKQLAFLFLSYGITMIQIGDVIMHSKDGNNNSYNKDDAINHLNWTKAAKTNSFENRIMEYIRNLIKFREENSIFQSENFLQSLTYRYDNGEIAQDNNDGYWYNCSDLFFGVLINSKEDRIYIAASKSENNMNIILPKNLENKVWYSCMDTSIFNHIDLKPKSYIEKNYILNPNALTIFAEKTYE